MLDEPCAGMNPHETSAMIELINTLRSQLKITIVLIEHDMKVVMNISDSILVLDHGEKIAQEHRMNSIQPKVIEAYLGSGYRKPCRKVFQRKLIKGKVGLIMYFEIRDLQVYYRAIHALKGISLTVNKGEIVALIGGNGAGKSSTLNSISGLVQGQSGVITYKDEVITGLPTDMIVKKGIIQVPEGRHIFPKLTVQENLEMGAFLNDNKAQVEEDMEHVYQLLSRMRERRTQPGGTLSGGEQQMLAIGRGMMGHPDLMLLVEPPMGAGADSGLRQII